MIRGSRCRRLCSLSACATLALGAAGAHADELKFDFSGKIQADLRFRLEDKSVGEFYDKVEAPVGVERNQDLLSFKAKAKYGKFSGEAAVDIYLNAVGNAAVKSFGSLQNYNAVQPFTVEPQDLYVKGRDLFFKGFDLTVGNQLIYWGVGDQFNPTNNLNSDDVRDPLLFGKQQPNFMVKADYWIRDNLSMSAVLVPVFKPALLPASSALGAADIQRMPFVDDYFRRRIEAQFGFAGLSGFPTVVHSLTPVVPGPSMDNMQFAYRVAGSLAEQDIAFSYYVGRTDFPQPFSNHTSEAKGVRCDPNKPTNCIDGVLNTDVLLGYPRMQVFGLNASGEFNPFKRASKSIHGIGYRVEVAYVVPQRTTLELTESALPDVLEGAGEYNYQGINAPGAAGGSPPAVVEDTPFLKWTIGLDYTFGSHVYVNAQWVHGLADEFGAGDWMHPGWQVRQSGVNTNLAQTQACVTANNGTSCATETMLPRLGDYLVLGADFKFLEDAGLLRIFTVWDMSGVTTSQYDLAQNKQVPTFHSMFTKEGFSASIYPELDYNFGNGLELGAGFLLLLGGDWTKFGDPAAGGSLFFTRGRYSF